MMLRSEARLSAACSGIQAIQRLARETTKWPTLQTGALRYRLRRHNVKELSPPHPYADPDERDPEGTDPAGVSDPDSTAILPAAAPVSAAPSAYNPRDQTPP